MINRLNNDYIGTVHDIIIIFINENIIWKIGKHNIYFFFQILLFLIIIQEMTK